LDRVDRIAKLLKTSPVEIDERVERLEIQAKEKDKKIEELQKELQQFAAEKSMDAVKTFGDVKVLMTKVDTGVDLKSQADQMRKQIGSGVVILGQILSADKISVVISVTKDLVKQYHAGKMIKELAPTIDGRGGGKPDMAQCGGSNPAGWGTLQEAVEKLITA
jgi:alanyl-tRNA synthetase